MIQGCRAGLRPMGVWENFTKNDSVFLLATCKNTFRMDEGNGCRRDCPQHLYGFQLVPHLVNYQATATCKSNFTRLHPK
jgi:hypothetical protein